MRKDRKKSRRSMKGMHTSHRPQRWGRVSIRICCGLTAFLMALAILAGCAARQKMRPAKAARQPSISKGSAVQPLEDGRQGFIISEAPEMNDASRREFARAVEKLNEKDYKAAIDLLEKIIEQSPKVTAPYINIAIAYQHVDKMELSEKHLKTAMELVPGHPVACNEYGLLCRKGGKFDEARSTYELALANFPDYYPVHRNLGILCDLYLNDLPCALEHYEIYSRAKPEDEQVKLWIADLKMRMGSN